MTKMFFTKVSPKAANGIRRIYEGKGYEVRAKVQGDGTVTVVAMKDESRGKGGNRSAKLRHQDNHAAA